MSSVKQRLYEKLGISEASILNNKIFSSDIAAHKQNQSLHSRQSNSKPSFGKSGNHSEIKKSLFAHHKMEILVPNSKAPTQIRSMKSEARIQNVSFSPNKGIEFIKKIKSNQAITLKESSKTKNIKSEVPQSKRYR